MIHARDNAGSWKGKNVREAEQGLLNLFCISEIPLAKATGVQVSHVRTALCKPEHLYKSVQERALVKT